MSSSMPKMSSWSLSRPGSAGWSTPLSTSFLPGSDPCKLPDHSIHVMACETEGRPLDANTEVHRFRRVKVVTRDASYRPTGKANGLWKCRRYVVPDSVSILTSEWVRDPNRVVSPVTTERAVMLVVPRFVACFAGANPIVAPQTPSRLVIQSTTPTLRLIRRNMNMRFGVGQPVRP